jgi:hypothetical protein
MHAYHGVNRANVYINSVLGELLQPHLINIWQIFEKLRLPISDSEFSSISEISSLLSRLEAGVESTFLIPN